MSGPRRHLRPSTRIAREDWHAHASSCRQCGHALMGEGDLCSDGVGLFTTYRRRKRRDEQLHRRL